MASKMRRVIVVRSPNKVYEGYELTGIHYVKDDSGDYTKTQEKSCGGYRVRIQDDINSGGGNRWAQMRPIDDDFPLVQWYATGWSTDEIEAYAARAFAAVQTIPLDK